MTEKVGVRGDIGAFFGEMRGGCGLGLFEGRRATASKECFQGN